MVDTPCEYSHRKPSSGGYVNMKIRGITYQQHRVYFERECGPIPHGMVVRHKCDNPPCCRLDHLELGTQHHNVRDAVKRGRRINKLTQFDADAIRLLRARGLSVKSIASRYNVSKQAVYNILNGIAFVDL